MKRSIAVVVALLTAAAAHAHDLITTESAEHYLRQTNKWQALATSSALAGERAEAQYRIGGMLDEIRELLNRDLATHGKVQGLPSNYLLAELQRQGAPLVWSEQQRRYRVNTHYFEQALVLAPRGPHAADAGLRLLQGRFYGSFETDPLAADEPWPQLVRQLALAEDLLARQLQGEAREEVEFIGAILHTRASLRAPDAASRRSHGRKARAMIAVFEARHPDSLRSAVMPILSAVLDKN
ncbi:MAG: hypothetical protein EXR30_01520 [Betaproteobacteria bacterium]|nr:hypothetical protein [Betaproteobacteria bacterium]